VTPQILAMGLKTLRQNAILARLVNQSYSTEAAQRGNVINIPVASDISARTVTPSVTINSNVDVSPTNVAITLDSWYEAPFNMSDTDQLSTTADFIPMNVSVAVKALINTIDNSIWAKHTGIFSANGTAGTTPFATNLAAAASARVALNKQLAPLDDRRAVLDPASEGNLLAVPDVLNFDKRGDQGGIIRGAIGTKLGFDWYLDQNLGKFTAGTSWITGWAVAGTGTVGAATLTVVHSTITVMGTIKVGDIFELGGNSYAITTAKTTASITDGTIIYFYPPLKTVIASDDALTVAAYATQYTVGLAFHRDAFAFASRPLASSRIPGAGNQISSVVDPVSGVALRLELSRQYKQDTYSFDALWGTGLVRKEYATKIMG